jgi:AcrR family transcriptional regulator
MKATPTPVRQAEARAGKRPRRGTPDETRSRIVMAAARVFEERGYHGTDTNDLAREAGYSPGTFYKHFDDKRSVFLAVYEDWVTREWADVTRSWTSASDKEDLAERVVDAVLLHHRTWPGFRASLRALVATDPVVRKFHREFRKKQIGFATGLGARDPETAALSMLVLERIADALADGEAQVLGIDPAAARAFLIQQILPAL